MFNLYFKDFQQENLDKKTLAVALCLAVVLVYCLAHEENKPERGEHHPASEHVHKGKDDSKHDRKQHKGKEGHKVKEHESKHRPEHGHKGNQESPKREDAKNQK